YQAITVSFGYDLDGHLTAYTNGKGNTTYNTYNSWGQVETTVEPPASTSRYTALADRTTTNSYDADGRLTGQTAPGGVRTAYRYDVLGNLTQESGTGAEAATATVTLGYDAFGDVTSAATSATAAAAATSETYTYDDRGDLLTATGSAGASSFGYTPDGLLASRTDAAGTTTYAYDSQDRLHTLADPLTGS